MGFDFDKLEGDFDDIKIVLEMMAQVAVPMFKAFRAQGLSTQEAAALTAAYINQIVPQEQQKPLED